MEQDFVNILVIKVKRKKILSFIRPDDTSEAFQCRCIARITMLDIDFSEVFRDDWVSERVRPSEDCRQAQDWAAARARDCWFVQSTAGRWRVLSPRAAIDQTRILLGAYVEWQSQERKFAQTLKFSTAISEIWQFVLCCILKIVQQTSDNGYVYIGLQIHRNFSLQTVKFH